MGYIHSPFTIHHSPFILHIPPESPARQNLSIPDPSSPAELGLARPWKAWRDSVFPSNPPPRGSLLALLAFVDGSLARQHATPGRDEDEDGDEDALSYVQSCGGVPWTLLG
jgi:hypothetical protein